MTEQQTPKVSVIIPTHNRAHLIMRAVNSVLEQTVQDFELVVVDDCSTDNTREVIEACKDPRVSYIKTDSNRGPAGARNAGIAIARGEYLAFLDSDDEWLPKKLELQVHAFETTPYPNLGALQGSVLCVPEDGEIYGDLTPTADGEWVRLAPALNGDAFDETLYELGLPGTGSVMMVHRRVIDAGIMFDESLPAYEDYEYFLHVSKYFQVMTLNAPLDRKFEDHGGPRVWNSSTIVVGGLGIIEKYREDLKSRPRIRQKRELAVAGGYAMEGDMVEARHHALLMLKARPFDIASWVVLAASLCGKRVFLRTLPLALADERLQKIGRKIFGRSGPQIPSRADW